jgi:DEAD/DEAH box helicase domain-containing protein
VPAHGEVHVVSRVVGFKKIKFYCNENVGSNQLTCPEQCTRPVLVDDSGGVVRPAVSAADRRDGVVGLAYAMRNVAPLADVRRPRFGLSIDGIASKVPSRGAEEHGEPGGAVEPTIFLYDNYPGGIASVSRCSRRLLQTRQLIDGCPQNPARPASAPKARTGPAAKSVAPAARRATAARRIEWRPATGPSGRSDVMNE